MDNLGVAINDTTLQIYAEEKGLGELATTQDKVNAAMQMFMEKTEYAAGNYAKENDTLSGSLTTLKAAWDNWLSGAGDTDALVDSVLGAADVIIKNIEQILPRLVEGISQLIEKLAPKLPEIIKQLLPSIINGAIALVSAIIPELPSILLSLVQAIVDGIGEAFGISGLYDNIFGWLEDTWNDIVEFFDPIIEEVSEMAELAWEAIEAVWSVVGGFFEAIWSVIKTAAEAMWKVVVGYFELAWENIKVVWGVVVSYFEAIWNSIKLIFSVVADVLTGNFSDAWEGIKEVLSTWSDFFQGLWDAVVEIFSNVYSKFKEVGSNLIDGIKEGISSAWSTLVSWFEGLWSSLFSNRTVSVNASTSTSSHASGLDYVPYNNYPALLHEGEAVLTSGEADSWRKGKSGSGNGISIIQNISAVAQTPVQLASATAAYFEQARWAI